MKDFQFPEECEGTNRSANQLNRQTTLMAEMRSNEIVIEVFELDDLRSEWRTRKEKTPLEKGIITRSGGSKGKKMLGLIPHALDSVTAVRICKDLGLLGKVYTKVIKNKEYVIFKGYAGLRNYFTGTRFLARNRKVVALAIGKAGIKHSVKISGVLTIVLNTVYNIYAALLKDEYILSNFLGPFVTDLVKVGISSIIAAAAGIGTAAVATTAALPIFVVIVTGLLTGSLLEAIDTKYRGTEKLVSVFMQYEKELASVRKKTDVFTETILEEAYRRLMSHGLRGF